METLAQMLEDYRNGERGLPSYDELMGIVAMSYDGPTAEDYSDMLRDLFFRYAAGGYNDDGGLVPLEKAKAKLQWVIDEEGKYIKESSC